MNREEITPESPWDFEMNEIYSHGYVRIYCKKCKALTLHRKATQKDFVTAGWVCERCPKKSTIRHRV